VSAGTGSGLVATELTLYAGCMPGVPFRDLVESAAGAGFSAVSMWPNIWLRAQHREGLSPATMRSLLDDHGLKVTDLDPLGDWLPAAPEGAPPAPFRNEMTRHDYFGIAAALGATKIVAVDLVGVQVDLDVAAAGFARLCDDASDHGLRVVLEYVVFTAIRDVATAWAIVERAGRANSGIMVDVAHHLRSGRDDAGLSAVPADRILGIQLCDGAATAPDDLLDEALYHRMLPGDGEMPVIELLALLGHMGVRADVGPELYRVESAGQPPDVVAADLMAATRSVLTAAGATF
jgi:sugar phosphate isomerase/epimerase